MTTKTKNISSKALESKFGDLSVYHTTVEVNDVISIAYAAIRGKDKEEGAVQRLLNKKRVTKIKDFILEGNTFFNTFILNWTNIDFKPSFDEGSITLPIVPNSAQIIDGQHRLAGLEEAIKEDKNVGTQKILVTICTELSTKNAAKIFLNINSEQKPVPKSLIYDLFGEVVEDQNHATNRATDIATELNENTDSPYYGLIKFPGNLTGSTGIELSAVVNALKKHLEPEKGTFSNHNLIDLQKQKNVIMNYFTAIRFFYEREGLWDNKKKNPFLGNAGFIGAVDFLMGSLIIKCADKKSFTVDTFKELLDLPKSSLLDKSSLKNFEGRLQRKKVTEFLGLNLLNSLPTEDEYTF